MTAKKATRAKTTADRIKPAEFREVAQGIRKIQDAIDAIQASGLSERAVVLLIADASGAPRGLVADVLDGMAAVSARFLTDDDD